MQNVGTQNLSTLPQTMVNHHATHTPRAPYAQDWRASRGRTIDEPAAADRTPFQRDRDRVIYSDAFRRLQYKTQVFMNAEEGDFRTRLTHTLEVAQLTRAICRSLGLDEDLSEVIALAHDIGHPPFGHSGEDALNDCMSDFGGFNHNVQTIRILRKLELCYPNFAGLNLSWETLEGIAKHNGPLVGERGAPMAADPLFADLDPTQHSCLEAQVAALTDSMAYKHHDLDDGLATGKLILEDVLTIPAFNRIWQQVEATYPKLDHYRKTKQTLRQMINRQVKDVLTTSGTLLLRHAPQTAMDVRALAMPLVRYSEELHSENQGLKAFLFERLYRHTSVNRFNFQSHRIVKDLFQAFMNHRKMLPNHWRAQLPQDRNDDAGKARVVCDYIASLTDRSAVAEHQRLFAPLAWTTV